MKTIRLYLLAGSMIVACATHSMSQDAEPGTNALESEALDAGMENFSGVTMTGGGDPLSGRVLIASVPENVMSDGGNQGDVDEPASVLPTQYSLGQNYPNPFNPSTEIRFEVPVSGFVSLKVYDVLGRIVEILVDEIQDAGYKVVRWDASAIPSGVYFYELTAGEFVAMSKMVLVR